MTKGPEPITLLHLSDLQFGRHHRFGRLGAAEAHPDAAFDTLLARLQQDLRDLVDEHGQPLRPELVLLTGDLAEWGRKSEMEDVLRFTRALAEALALPPERLVIIPGNHDINRNLCEAYFAQCKGEETEPRPPYWDKWKHFVWLFRELYGLGARVEFNERTPWSLFEIDDLKVVVAALNTTMAESHRDEDHHGLLGEAQLRWFEDKLTAYQQRGWLRIAALHHNVRRGPVRDDENLRDADDFTRILGSKINLVLHGHTHDGKLDWLTPEAPILSTGSAAVAQDARPEEVPNQYQMIRVHADHIEHWTRAYAPDRKRWIGDTRADPAGNAWHMAYPVAFTDVAAAFPAPAPARQAESTPGWEADMLAERLDYGHARSDFLSRVERVCRLRVAADRADVRADIERRRIGTPAIEYLEVCASERGMTSLYPVGAVAGEITPEALAEFIVRVHDRYRATDPGVWSTLVYGGQPAADALVTQARAQRVDLRSFIEYQGLIDFRAHVRDQTRRLEEDRRYPPALYVPQRMRYRVFDEEHQATSALDHITEWLHAPDAQLVLVLGEFGTGKSFLLRELARRLGAEDGLAPIFIDMRDLDKGRTLDELLGQYFARHRREFSPEKFGYMLEAGRIALLFDGFDELAVRLTYPRAAEHFDTVLEAVRGNAKVIVTSRTQHFQSDQQVTALGRKVRSHASARIATLQPFDHAQIRAFLRNRFGDDQRAGERLALIDEVKDLLGLSHNPRMLSFIADLDEAALRAARNAHGDITAASLYRTILDTWLTHEHERIHPRGAPPSLQIPELRDAVSTLAVRMWSRSAPYLGLDELTRDAAALVQRLAETTLDADMAAFQLGSGSLLVRDGEGRFSFLHQSVLEWLAADAAANELRTGGTSVLPAAAPMSALMAQFFVDLSGREAAHRWARAALAAAGDDPGLAIAKKNALVIIERTGVADEAEPLDESAEEWSTIDLAGQDLAGQDLAGQDLRGHDLSGADLSETMLVGADLSGARPTRASLVGADLTRASLKDADLRGADFSGATLTGADLRGAALEGAVFRRCKLIGAQWDAGALDHCDTFGAALDARDHTGHITARAACKCVAWNQAGLIATAEENIVRVWDAASGRELLRLKGHRGLVRSLAFSPDGAVLASGSDDWTVRLWSVASGQEIIRLQRHKARVRGVAFSPIGMLLASGSDDGTVQLWEVADGREHLRLQGHAKRVQSVAFSPDGMLLASGCSDGTVRVWTTASGHELKCLQGHLGGVRSVAFSPDGMLLASGSDDWTVRLWAAADGKSLMRLEAHASAVKQVAFSPDGSLLATGSRDHTVQLWDLTSGDRLTQLRHGDEVDSLAFSSDGSLLASTSGEQFVRLWDLTSGRETLRLQGHEGWVRSVAFSPDGTRLASTSKDGMVQLWNVAGGQEVMRLQGHQSWNGSVTFSPDGTRLASGSWEAVQLWDVASGQEALRLQSAPGLVSSVAFSPDGTRLASGSASGAVRLYKVAGGQEDVDLLGHAGLVTSMTFSPDGTYLASCAEDGTVRLWNVASGNERLRLLGHQGSVWNVAFSPSGTYLASCSADGTVRLWSVAVGRETMQFEEYDIIVTSVTFSSDGTYLVGGSSDGAVRLWDVASGRRAVMALQGHDSVVTSVAFSSDGRYLATGSWDAARIWSMQTGECLAILAHLPRGWVAMTPDGRYKTGGDVAGGFWHTIGLCRFEPGELDEHIPGLRLPDDAILVPP
jgi:WD40 repeat protein